MSAPKVTRAVVSGATVLTIEERSLPVVRFVVALRRGALFDPAERSGATRATLELMLRGTKRHDRESFNRALEELGSSLSATPGSETAFFRAVSLKRNLEATVALAAEALAEPRFDPEELEALRDELVDGLRAERDDDDSVADLFLRRAIYRGHRLARSPLGEIDHLQRLTVDDARALHATSFTPDQLVLAFAGDVTPVEAEAHARRLLAGLPQPAAAAPAVVEALPDHQGLSILVVDKPERAQVQLRVAKLTVEGKHPEMWPLWLGVVAFGGTFTSPFTQEVRDKRGWSYVAHADLSRRQLLRAPLVLRTVPPMADAVECLALELQLYDELAGGAADAEVLERARSYVLNRYPFEVATANDLLFPAVRLELMGLPLEELFTAPQRIEAITLAQVRGALQRHLAPGAADVVMVATAASILPALRERFPKARIETVDFQANL